MEKRSQGWRELDSFVDTHCHLNFNLFEADLDQVLERAGQAGVDRLVLPGIDLETSRQVLKLCEQYPTCSAAVGVHPNDALSWDGETLAELRDLCAHPAVVAVGEIGLDYHWHKAPPELQQSILLMQLDLAAEMGKPVILHSREALADLWPMLREWQQELVRQGSPLVGRCGVLHSYDGDLTTAQDALAHGFQIGVGGPVTFKNAPQKQALVQALPLEGLLLETDAPFLAPQPMRGRRNEPAYIPVIAEKIAQLHTQPLAKVAQITTQNAERLLGWRLDR
jgi:TatD DNase family protein